jgi:predicted permease
VVIVLKLVAVFAVVAVGFVAGRTRRLGGEERLQTVANLAFFVFAPALLFRTTAGVDLATLRWLVVVVYFGPVLVLLLLVYGWQRLRGPREPARPAVRAIAVSFGNTVQLGIPMAVAVFGATGLAIHVTIVSVHAVILLTVVTILVERDLAGAAGDQAAPRPLATAARTARRTVVHPVVLPILAGLAVNAAGLTVPGPVDDVLAVLAQAVVPLCLVLIGMSLAHHGLSDVVRGAVGLSVVKLFVVPAAVLGTAYAAGLRGLTLAVVVLCAAMPIGANAQLFAQRYRAGEGEVTAGLVLSTMAFAVTGPAWLFLVSRLTSW